MTIFRFQKTIQRAWQLCAVLVLFTLVVPASVWAADPPTVDITANGSNGPVDVTDGDSFSYSWSSTNSTACELTSPASTGISLSGNSTIVPTSPWYPAVGGSVTFTVSCSDGVDTVSDSVTVNIVAAPLPDPAVTVDIKADGSNGPIDITDGTNFSYDWTSTGATACELTSPASSGISLSGSSTVAPSNPWYPAVGGSVTFTISCSDGTSTVADSVVVNIIPAGGGGATPAPTVDITVNGSNGPVDVTDGDSFLYSWTSTDTTACELTSPASTGISLAGSSTVAPSNPWYPAVGSSVTLTVSCTNSTSTTTDSVVVNIVSAGGGGGGGGSCTAPTFTSSLTVSGQQNVAFSYTFSATSTVTTSLVLTVDNSDLPAGLSYSTTTAAITGTPTVSGTFNVDISVTDTCSTNNQVLVLDIAPASTGGGGGGGTGGGGGGGSSGGGSSRPSSGGDTIPTFGNYCPYLTDYMRIDFNNDSRQVIFLQTFLNVHEGYDYVEINGVFDEATFRAVSEFQDKYRNDVLEPWTEGQAPTGYVYITTLHKINELMGCPQGSYTLSQQQEIDNYVPQPGVPAEVGVITPPPVVGLVPESPPQGQNNLAAALFAFPDSLGEALQCFSLFIIILIVLYILSSLVRNVLYKDTPENVLKRFKTKWITFILGLVVALILAHIFGWLCLTIPLLITLILSILWITLEKRRNSIRASFKAWYLVFSGRTKTLWNKAIRRAKEELLLENTETKVITKHTENLPTPKVTLEDLNLD